MYRFNITFLTPFNIPNENDINARMRAMDEWNEESVSEVLMLMIKLKDVTRI